MSEKPSYLGLLNAIAVGEAGGEKLFNAWAAATPNADVRCVAEMVALREAEHSKSFAKRINELGYSVIPKDDPSLPARLATAAATDISDCEKFEKLGFARIPSKGPDIFSKFFDDISIDIQTGELLGRYVSEERDTGRKLKACHAALAAEAAVANSDTPASVTALSNRLDRIEAMLCELTEALASAPAPRVKATAGRKK